MAGIEEVESPGDLENLTPNLNILLQEKHNLNLIPKLEPNPELKYIITRKTQYQSDTSHTDRYCST